MNRPREQIRDRIASVASMDSRENILRVPGGTAPPVRYGSPAALDLLSQLAEVIGGMQDRAVELETHFRALAQGAVEKLHLAEARIHSSEVARSLTQETLNKVITRLKEAEREVTRTRSQIATAETQLANAEERMRAADTRAVNAEKAVTQIEHAIENQLIGLQRNLTSGSARVA